MATGMGKTSNVGGFSSYARARRLPDEGGAVTEQERRRVLKRLRDERLAGVKWDPRRTAYRSLVASCLLEGVDATKWVKR